MPSIRRMIDSVVDRNVEDCKWIDAFKATDVVAILPGVRAALVVGMDAAYGTKVR